MTDSYIKIDRSHALGGEVSLSGAKNAVLVIIASLLLTKGKSVLYRVPNSDDVQTMVEIMRNLGASIEFDTQAHILVVDTTAVCNQVVPPVLMNKIRASVLIMGPLLARFGTASVALPGGDNIGARPINYTLDGLTRMGTFFSQEKEYLQAQVSPRLKPGKIILEYPSVGATENIMMAAALTPGITRIVNAALEPEVVDLIIVLRKMGAHITIHMPASIEIEGMIKLNPIEHEIMPDRLEAGSLLLAAAVTGGDLYIPDARADDMEVFLAKLEEMGHIITIGNNNRGIRIKATKHPKGVSFKTAPYPGFPTDLQAPMMVAQCVASGTSMVEETVYENRMQHIKELHKMGATITQEHQKARIYGGVELHGASVIASDIRSSYALVLAGLVAQGSTVMKGVDHWRRGYDALEKKLALLGASIVLITQKNP